MCCKGKCLGCIPVENGCLVFGILSAIASILLLIAILVVGVLLILGITLVPQALKNDPALDTPHPLTGGTEYAVQQPNLIEDAISALSALGGLILGFVCLGLCILSIIAIVFSIQLCKGICEHKPGRVKAYFIYGVVILVLSVIAKIVSLALSIKATSRINDFFPAIGLLVGCVIYALILWMVHATYTKLSKGAVYNGVTINNMGPVEANYNNNKQLHYIR